MKNTMENAFEQAIESIKTKTNAATIWYSQGAKTQATAKMREIKAIISTIEIFTGREVAVNYTDIECITYRIVENPYGDETLLYEHQVLVAQ